MMRCPRLFLHACRRLELANPCRTCRFRGGLLLTGGRAGKLSAVWYGSGNRICGVVIGIEIVGGLILTSLVDLHLFVELLIQITLVQE